VNGAAVAQRAGCIVCELGRVDEQEIHGPPMIAPAVLGVQRSGLVRTRLVMAWRCGLGSVSRRGITAQ
jgi:hypothetical protein